jgi:urea transport system substrate-binding protein
VLEDIKVGILHSLSGTMAISETVLKDTVLMAIDEINAKGGVLGKKLEPVVDPASNWPLFAEKTKQLLGQDKVSVIFGCWTSVAQVGAAGGRGNERPAVLRCGTGEELSKNVFYTGAAPNQPFCRGLFDEQDRRRQALGGWHRLYVPPPTRLRAYLKSKACRQGHRRKYRPCHSDYQTIVADVKKFSQGGKTAVVSTSTATNVPFYKELGNAGLKAKDVGVAFSVGRGTARGHETAGRPPGGLELLHVDQSPANTEFISKCIRPEGQEVSPTRTSPTNDPMEATYIGINMWEAGG